MLGPDGVRRLLQRCEEMPHGAARIAVAEEAVRHADALGDLLLQLETRTVATSSYEEGGELAKAFVTFAWCLAEYDRSATARADWVDDWLRWYFQWMVA